MFDEIDSVDSVDVIDLVGNDDAEIKVVYGTSVESCLVNTVITGLVEVSIGEGLDTDDVWWKGVVCIIIAGSLEHVDFSLILE